MSTIQNKWLIDIEEKLRAGKDPNERKYYIQSEIPQDIYSQVAPVARAQGVPDYIWASIASMETGGTFDPRALGDNGKSFGLFQLYTGGGQGDSYKNNPTVLYDPGLNAEVAMPAISKAYKNAKDKGMEDGPELAAYVAVTSGHPTYLGFTGGIVNKAADAVKKAAGKLMGLGDDTGSGSAAGTQEPINNISDIADYDSPWEFIKAMFKDPETRQQTAQKVFLVTAGISFVLIGSLLVADIGGRGN